MACIIDSCLNARTKHPSGRSGAFLARRCEAADRFQDIVVLNIELVAEAME